MRAFFEQKDMEIFLQTIRDKGGLSLADLAQLAKVSQRTLFDWRKCKHSVSMDFMSDIGKKYNVCTPKPIMMVDENWSKSESGRLGGVKSYALYGNPATIEGCRKGGMKAIETHRKRGAGPFVQKDIHMPYRSKELAEIVGIFLGDGGISTRQVTVTLHKNDDREYVNYVSSLILKLFKIQPSIRERESTLNIVVSRTKMVEFLIDMGFCVGSKVKYQISVPKWVASSTTYRQKCARGLFDTDGCVYIDTHKYKYRVYKNIAMNFTNRSLPLLKFFKNELELLGLQPTQKTKYSVFLRRESDIVYYFRTIGSSNQKHISKLNRFLHDKHGRVPKWS